MSDKKLDLFKEVLPALYSRDFDFFENLSDDEKKTVTPVTIMRWLTGTSDAVTPYQIGMINKFVNSFYKELYKDADLMWRLMAASTILHPASKNIPRHQWLAGPKRSSTTNRIDRLLFDKYPYMNEDELKIIKRDITADSLTDLLKDMGWADKEIKELVAEFKKSNG